MSAAREPVPSIRTAMPARIEVRAVILVLHGGKANSRERARPWHLSSLRMLPLAAALARSAGPSGAAVCQLRYRYRGWNGAAEDPVHDARWALAEIRRRHGEVPVVLVGHSMGGRTALRVADDPCVTGVVALAPWLPEREPTGPSRGVPVSILHGSDDRWTDPRASLAWLGRARAEHPRDAAELIEIRRAGHFMLRRIGLWHSLTVLAVARFLAAALPTSPAGRTDSGLAANPLWEQAPNSAWHVIV